MIKRNFSKYLNLPVWVIWGMPLFYWLWSLKKYTGPAYLADEIGYLSNAIFLSGHWVDGGSSYHAGFSLLLAPLFLLLPDTVTIWKGALFVNALLWILSFYLIDRLIIKWSPSVSSGKRTVVLLFVSLYPTWMTMAGYVFPTSAFIALFLAGLIVLISVLEMGGKQIYFFTILVGLLYWIHPIGFVIAGVSIVIVAIWTLQNNKSWHVVVFHTIGCIALILIYKGIFHPWLLKAMTPEGYLPLVHYPKTSDILLKIKQFDYWVAFVIKSLGQISYLLVGSLGLAFWGIYGIFFQFRQSGCNNWKSFVGIYIVAALLGVVLIGAMNLTLVEDASRIDHWIYGRYLDSVCIPIMAIGVVTILELKWGRRIFLAIPCILVVIMSGFVIQEYYLPTQPNNIVNTVAFWPQYVLPKAQMFYWMLIGALVIGGVAIGGGGGILLGMLPIFVVATIHQSEWHKNILNKYSAPTSIVDLVRENYSFGTCVGFDWESLRTTENLFQRERFWLYKYYFYDYRYRRVSKEEWLQECDGPILTYTPTKFEDVGRVMARENSSGLFFVERNSRNNMEVSNIPAIHGITLAAGNCLLEGCFSRYADELIDMSQVGSLKNNYLVDTQRAGYLFYGPYVSLNKGNYKLIMYGDFSKESTPILDIVSNKGREVHYEERLCNERCPLNKIIFSFEIKRDVTDLEIRLRVAEQDRIAIKGYEIYR